MPGAKNYMKQMPDIKEQNAEVLARGMPFYPPNPFETFVRLRIMTLYFVVSTVYLTRQL